MSTSGREAGMDGWAALKIALRHAQGEKEAVGCEGGKEGGCVWCWCGLRDRQAWRMRARSGDLRVPYLRVMDRML